MGDGFEATLILWLNLLGTFVFGLSGGLAAVRARLDVFGVVVLAGVVGLAGGVTRDLLIGAPPAMFRDWRYLAAVGAAAAVCFFAGHAEDQSAKPMSAARHAPPYASLEVIYKGRIGRSSYSVRNLMQDDKRGGD